jgi:UDP-hydrolysing UDP-N-acetyl-D-glucosamine 2-epimerase
MKNIFIVTSARSEFGILQNIILELFKSKKIKSNLVVTGIHLEKKFGKTVDEISKLKIPRVVKIKIKNLKKTTSKNSSLVASELVAKFNLMILKNKIDSVILFGDRFEILAIAYTFFLHKIPIIHIGGGETTFGSSDESVRHALSKLSNFHFVTHQIHKKRLIQMGENKKNIFLIGSPGIENIKKTNFLTKNEIEKKLGLKFLKINIIVNLYPITNQKGKDKFYITQLLKALELFKECRIIFTLPAFEIGSDIIIKLIKLFVKKNKNSFFYKSLGSQNYLSTLKFCNLMIGNSSSGLIEAPLVGLKVINIGDRQNGRIRPKGIINCRCDFKSIKSSINLALRTKTNYKNIYPNIKSSIKFVKLVERLNFKKSLVKKFIDIELNNGKK